MENPKKRGAYRGLIIDGKKHIYVLATEIKRIYGYSIEFYMKKSKHKSFNED